MNTKQIPIDFKALKKYIYKRNQIVKAIQSMELTKTIYEPLDDYGEREFERVFTIDIEFNKAAHVADTILQQIGMNKPNYLKSIEGEYYHLEEYTSNKSLNKTQ